MPSDLWLDVVTTETKILVHENLRSVVREANTSKLPFRLFRDQGTHGLVETVVLSDIAFQSDGITVRRGLWEDTGELRLLLTEEGAFNLQGNEVDR